MSNLDNELSAEAEALQDEKAKLESRIFNLEEDHAYLLGYNEELKQSNADLSEKVQELEEEIKDAHYELRSITDWRGELDRDASINEIAAAVERACSILNDLV